MSHWVNVWRCISDCAHVLPTGTPFHQICLEAFAYQTGVREDGNLKLWWVVQHDEVTTLLLNIGTVQSSTDIYVYMYLFLVQTQLRYIYLLLSHHHSPTSSDLAIMITPFSAHILEQMHLSTRLHPSHPCVLSDCLTSMNKYVWQTPTAVVSRVPGTIGTCPCSCFKTKIWPHPKAKLVPVRVAVLKPRYDLNRKQNLVSIYPRCSVIGKNVISGACGLHWAHEPINVISVNFKDSHF